LPSHRFSLLPSTGLRATSTASNLATSFTRELISPLFCRPPEQLEFFLCVSI
jgi:hypothetical protein